MTEQSRQDKQEFEYDYIARALSVQQWEFLADHFEGNKPIIRDDHRESRTRFSLVQRKLVVYRPPTPAPHPTHTVLTEKGHAVMCTALGMMADMLTRNGYDGINNPKETDERTGYGKFYVARPRRPLDDRNIVESESGPLR